VVDEELMKIYSWPSLWFLEYGVIIKISKLENCIVFV